MCFKIHLIANDISTLFICQYNFHVECIQYLLNYFDNTKDLFNQVFSLWCIRLMHSLMFKYFSASSTRSTQLLLGFLISILMLFSHCECICVSLPISQQLLPSALSQKLPRKVYLVHFFAVTQKLTTECQLPT